MKLPSYAKKYFWDINANQLNAQKKPRYVVKRLAELGDQRSVRWAWRNFSKNDWKVSLQSRGVSIKTKNFWLPLLRYKK